MMPTTTKMQLDAHMARDRTDDGAISQRFAGDQPDVIHREHGQPSAQDQSHPPPGEAQRHRDSHQDEYDAGHRDRPFLVDLDRVFSGQLPGILGPGWPRWQFREWCVSWIPMRGIGRRGQAFGRRLAPGPARGSSPRWNAVGRSF